MREEINLTSLRLERRMKVATTAMQLMTSKNWAFYYRWKSRAVPPIRWQKSGSFLLIWLYRSFLVSVTLHLCKEQDARPFALVVPDEHHFFQFGVLQARMHVQTQFWCTNSVATTFRRKKEVCLKSTQLNIRYALFVCVYHDYAHFCDDSCGADFIFKGK